MLVSQFQVLLYYKYVDIDDPEKLKEDQMYLCESLNLKARIIVSKEGINGTLEGKTLDTERYIQAMRKINFFKDMVFKKSAGTGSAFPKLSIKVRPEIIALGVPNLSPNKISGKYIDADKLHSWFEDKKEFYIIDMRNDYEYLSGYFENSIFSNTHNFFDLPKALPRLVHLKDKTVVTVCTGGVRCEKASGFLLMNGFNDVYQLKDGIQTYMEKYPNKHFKGKLYVFDNRLTLGFNTEDKEHEIVGRCMKCNKVCDSYVNCAYNFCHFHYISCEECLDRQLNLPFCDTVCKEKYLQQLSSSLN